MRAAWRLLRDAVIAWSDDGAASMGAALAYYTLFSIAPLLLIVISVAGLVFGEQAARGEILEQLRTLMGTESARTIEAMLQQLNRPDAGAWGTVTGVVALLVGATTVFAELQGALDRIWRAPPHASGSVWRFLRARLLSLGLMLGIGFLLIVSLVISAALAALGRWWGPQFESFVQVADLLNFALSFVALAVMFAMIYKWMPRVAVAWRDVWIGAALTAWLFAVGKSLIGFYIGSSGVASVFGAAASLVVLLLWVYYSAQIFLLGAELTWVYAVRHGSLKGRQGVVGHPGAAPGRRADGLDPAQESGLPRAAANSRPEESSAMPACTPASTPLLVRSRLHVPPPGPIEMPPTPEGTPPPQAPDLPPEIIDPIPPGIGEPVREPGPPVPPLPPLRAGWHA